MAGVLGAKRPGMSFKSLLASSTLLALAACAGPHPDELATSRAEFERQASDASGYTYARYFVSFTGAWHRTTIAVEDGVVVSRSYEDSYETTWTETGADLGSHEAGHPVATMPELYDECGDEILTVDSESNEVVLEIDEQGLLRRCTYTPIDCDDDCTFGISIESIEFEPGGCGAAFFCG
jgi:hypothetical protein